MSDRVLGSIIPHITIEPPFILRLQNVQGVETLWDNARAGIEPIVFTGSSLSHMGFSPYVFNEEIKANTRQNINSVNVSVWGAVAAIQHDLIQNLIIPNHPKVIIYGIEGRALSTAVLASIEALNDFKNKPLGHAVSIQSTTERDLLMWLFQHSSWVGYRDNFREWLTGIRAVNQLEFDPTDLDALGHFRNPIINDRDPANIKGFIHFAVDQPTRKLMRDIGSMCKQNGVTCILLNMPLHNLAYQYISDSDETLYRDVIQEARLPIWDFNTKACRTLLGDASFYNLSHLNERGAQIFSKIVADAYANVFFNVPLSSDAHCATLGS